MATRKKKTESKPKASKKKAPPAAPASTAPVKIEPFTQQLACALKREEVEERAQRAAHLLADRDNREADFDEKRKLQNAEIKKIENEIRAVSQEVRERVTYRDVQCERRFVYAEGVVKDFRLDTGEVIFERPMSDAEKQRDLFDPGAGGGAAGGGGDLDSEFDEADETEEGDPKPDGKPDDKPEDDAAQ